MKKSDILVLIGIILIVISLSGLLLYPSHSKPEKDELINEVRAELKADSDFANTMFKARFNKLNTDFLESMRNVGSLSYDQKEKILAKYYKDAIYIIKSYTGKDDFYSDISSYYFYSLDEIRNGYFKRKSDINKEISLVVDVIERSKKH